MSKPQLSSFSLHREGTLQLKVVGDNHCGHPSAVNADHQVQIRYQVDLVGSPTLDAQGFLVDQEALHDVFVEAARRPEPWTESCEMLCLVMGEALLESIHEIVVVRGLRVQLSPFPHGGWLSATFGEVP